MKYLLIIIMLFLNNCSKPKTVLICGDHICVNKAEAEQFFEKNLSLEVKIIENKEKNEIDLVELNLIKNQKGDKEISIVSRKKTKKDLKVLSNKEIIDIKKSIKDKKKEKKIVKKLSKEKKSIQKEKKKSKTIKELNQSGANIKINKKDNNKSINLVDVCTILEKCSIDEISKYLLDDGRNKKFPDITTRQ